MDIKQEEYPIKLSILLAILKDNILARLQNIFQIMVTISKGEQTK